VAQGQFQWLAVANVKDEGPLQLIVTVKRPGEPSVSVPFTWTVGPVVGTRLGGSPLAPLTSMAALVTAVVGLVVFAAYAIVRARRRRSAIAESVEGPERIPATSHRR
jgi:hypothetical protein